VGLKLLDEIGPTEMEHIGIYSQVAQSYPQCLREGLHHLYHVEPPEHRVPAREKQNGEVVGDPGVRYILGVHQGSTERFSVGVSGPILFL